MLKNIPFVKKFGYLTILDRYIIKEITNPFILAVGGFAIIGLVDILFVLVDIFVRSKISILVLIRLLSYKLPAVIVMFFPMAVIFSVMLLFVRMAKDNELSVLRTSGINAFRIILPAIITTILISFLSFYINEKLVPMANVASDNLIKRELKKSPLPNIKKNTVFKNDNRFFYIKEIDTKNNIMESVLVFEQQRRFPRILTAESASFNDYKWVLQNGMIQEFNDDGSIKFVNEFDEMKINVQQNIRTFYRDKKKPKEMDSKELREEIMNMEKGGLNTRALKVEFQLKLATPAMCAIFGLVGIAFCLSFVKTGKDWWGVILAICTAVLTVGFYFFLLALFRAFAKEGSVPIMLGAWTPNLIYGFIASSMIYYQCKYR
tara:strand:+ start:1079 stop:2206 length:1128 start_codon:yes stop_codon:yes gene_type:complete